MKRSIFLLSSLALSPLMAFSNLNSLPVFSATEPSVMLGDQALTAETPYYYAGSAVELCDFHSDWDCNAFLEVDGSTATLHFDNYMGPAITITGYETVNLDTMYGLSVNVYHNGEYGLKTDAKNLNIGLPGQTDGNLYFDIRSLTDRANAIWLTNGSVNFVPNVYMGCYLVAESNYGPTEDLVTAITTPFNQSINHYHGDWFTLYNERGDHIFATGNFNELPRDPRESIETYEYLQDEYVYRGDVLVYTGPEEPESEPEPEPEPEETDSSDQTNDSAESIDNSFRTTSLRINADTDSDTTAAESTTSEDSASVATSSLPKAPNTGIPKTK